VARAPLDRWIVTDLKLLNSVDEPLAVVVDPQFAKHMVDVDLIGERVPHVAVVTLVPLEDSVELSVDAVLEMLSSLGHNGEHSD
jgi:hypothetical protein